MNRATTLMRRHSAHVLCLALGIVPVACNQKPDAEQPSVAATASSDTSKPLAAELAQPVNAHLISETGMGGVEVGATLDEVRRTIPSAKFTRTSDGEGVALVEMTFASGPSLVLWAEEDDPAAPIDWSKKIRMIETFSPGFRTREGVHPGSIISDVERIYGEKREIQRSEIESLEYIFFARQPAGITFRLNNTGIFAPGSDTTTQVASEGMIQSIAVSSSR